LRTLHSLILLTAFGLMVGCGPPAGPTLYPVSGKVTFEGKAVTPAMVTYSPDSEKGHVSNIAPSGQVDADGNYTLMTEDKAGAPKGWYKVMINTNVMPKEMPKDGKMSKAIGIPAKYSSVTGTTLSIEVTEAGTPAQYELKLMK